MHHALKAVRKRWVSICDLNLESSLQSGDSDVITDWGSVYPPLAHIYLTLRGKYNQEDYRATEWPLDSWRWPNLYLNCFTPQRLRITSAVVIGWFRCETNSLADVIRDRNICASFGLGLPRIMSASGFILVVLAVSLWPGKMEECCITVTWPVAINSAAKDPVVIVGF